MQRIISAGIIIFRKTPQGTKFLILYHGRNYWNFPKGKVELGERNHETALREVQEETGLKPTELRPMTGFQTQERFSYQRGKDRVVKTVVLYLAETRQANITVSHEHEGYGWFTYSEARRILAKYKDSLRILDQAHDFLRSKSASHRQPHSPRAHTHVSRSGEGSGQSQSVPGSGEHPQ